MSLPFGPPQQVSPLIRGFRFALLIAGIIYARGKQKLYDSLEASHREEQAKKKIIRDKEIALLKAKIAKEEAEALKLFESGKMFETGDSKDSSKPESSDQKPESSDQKPCK